MTAASTNLATDSEQPSTATAQPPESDRSLQSRPETGMRRKRKAVMEVGQEEPDDDILGCLDDRQAAAIEELMADMSTEERAMFMQQMAMQSESQRLDADVFYRQQPTPDEMALEEMYDRFGDGDKDEMMQRYMQMMQVEEERERVMRQMVDMQGDGSQVNGDAAKSQLISAGGVGQLMAAFGAASP